MSAAHDRKGPKTGLRSRPHRVLFLLPLLVTLGGAEWLLRSIGIAPWRPIMPQLRVEPGGKFTQTDAVLGYRAIPGSFVVTDDRGRRTRSTHLPDSLRITRPLPSYAGEDDRPQIWIFGCSFTYGSGLNDEETFPWQLQERLTDYQVVNYGMGGYGTIQAFFQLRESLEQTVPEVAILAYASFHDIRNTFLRKRRKAVAPFSRLGPFVQPYARLKSDGELAFRIAAVEYNEFPLMRRSAIAHLLESAYNELESRRHDSRAVTEALVLEMSRLARAHGAVFVVADIFGGANMRGFAEGHGIPAVDISLPRATRYTLGPRDPHPNARAARIYAERLARFIAPML